MVFANLFSGFNTTAERHRVVHHDEIICFLLLPPEFLNFFDSFKAVRGRVCFYLVLLKHGYNGKYIVKVVVDNQYLDIIFEILWIDNCVDHLLFVTIIDLESHFLR